MSDDRDDALVAPSRDIDVIVGGLSPADALAVRDWAAGLIHRAGSARAELKQTAAEGEQLVQSLRLRLATVEGERDALAADKAALQVELDAARAELATLRARLEDREFLLTAGATDRLTAGKPRWRRRA